MKYKQKNLFLPCQFFGPQNFPNYQLEWHPQQLELLITDSHNAAAFPFSQDQNFVIILSFTIPPSFFFKWLPHFLNCLFFFLKNSFDTLFILYLRS